MDLFKRNKKKLTEDEKLSIIARSKKEDINPLIALKRAGYKPSKRHKEIAKDTIKKLDSDTVYLDKNDEKSA